MRESKLAARIWVPGDRRFSRGRGIPRWNPTAMERIVRHKKAREVRACCPGKWRLITMPRENEGVQDQGGKHGGQKTMRKPGPRPAMRPDPGRGAAPDQGIVRDERGQEQPRDKELAQQVSRR